jgi:hypothetical protein
MGLHFFRYTDELGGDLVLAPERYDPRSQVAGPTGTGARLDDLVEVAGTSVQPAAWATGAPLLVLDTTHAYEGFVLARQPPQRGLRLASAKRRLQPGDVIISRLRPYLRQVAYVDEGLFRLDPDGNQVAASSEFYVLRRSAGLEPAALVPFLLSPSVQSALAAGQEGGHHPRFRRELLASLTVPQAIVQAAAATAERIQAGADALRAALRDSQTLAATAEQAILWGRERGRHDG